jgi:hypothetical protein
MKNSDFATLRHYNDIRDYMERKALRTEYYKMKNLHRWKWCKSDRVLWFKNRWNTQAVVDTLEYKLYHWHWRKF